MSDREARGAAGVRDAAATPARRSLAWADAAWCLLLVAVAVAVREVYLRRFGIASQEGGDMAEYIALTRNLLEGRGFTSDGIAPSMYRPPLFSWLLAAWCRLLGDASLETMVRYQVLTQALCAPATVLLALRLQASRGFALAAGGLMSVHPFVFSALSLMLQEPTQTLVATLMALALASWWRAPNAPRGVVAGLLLGACALAKSPFLAGAPILLLVSFGLRGEGTRQGARQVWLVVVVAAAAILPWTIRNAVVSGGRFVPINSQNLTLPIWMVADGNFRCRTEPEDPPYAPFTLAKGVGFTYGNEEGVEYLRRRNEEMLAQGVRGPAVVEGVAVASKAYLLRHPVYVLRLAFRGAVLTVVPYAVGPTRDLPLLRVAAMVLIHLPLAAGLVAGFLLALRRRDGIIVTLSLLTASYLMVHALVANEGGRYTLPVLPILMAISGYALFGAPRASGELPRGRVA